MGSNLTLTDLAGWCLVDVISLESWLQHLPPLKTYTTGWLQLKVFKWNWVDGTVQVIDCAIAQSQVIVTEGMSMLSLLEHLIMSNDAVAPRNQNFCSLSNLPLWMMNKYKVYLNRCLQKWLGKLPVQMDIIRDAYAWTSSQNPTKYQDFNFFNTVLAGSRTFQHLFYQCVCIFSLELFSLWQSVISSVLTLLYMTFLSKMKITGAYTNHSCK